MSQLSSRLKPKDEVTTGSFDGNSREARAARRAAEEAAAARAPSPADWQEVRLVVYRKTA